jgi:NIPSNAP
MNQALQDVIKHRRTTNVFKPMRAARGLFRLGRASRALSVSFEFSGEYMVYELRIYRVMNGRMADLLARFEHHTVPIMARHGFLQVGFWTTIVGRSEQHLTYLLAWESLAQRQEKWDAFLSDPEWLAIRKSTEENGPLIFDIENSLLRPTNFSAAK